ncbi:uncharacterized protein HMPREF1541_04691 [Cyphellophora europaea CBS 101466]|uniref:Transcription factor domain-containing protein n=1 Tax=Cyphellophora europaea (strain CBS 101466) TaxID=1220924 RepID=W2RXM5_CYPE1|nr:uncharacterized protein HMPREF1541_04691 [Cyphellophora europaea CBS 101466]ETN40414.1 hypothetical protein HMPREF1541_04691 [Cyphellophora europaea CBS 101466]
MDPFGSFVFGTDSNVSQLIFHWDSFILQPVGETHDSHLSGLRNEAWQMLVDSFQDICRGYAFLACAAKLRATTTKSPAIAALAEQYRHVALIDLRQRLQREGVTDDAPGCMLSLIIADLANADSDSARVHMRFLKKIIQPADGRRVSIPPGAGHILLWQDIQVATLSLKRPLLDLERWEREQSPGLWLPTSPTFRAQLEAGSQVDGDALADPYLERLFQDAKKYGMVLQSLYSDQVPLSRTNSRKLSTGLLLLCGRLLAYYLDRCEASDYFDGGVDADLANIQAAAASLTAIYWVRAMTRDEMGPVRHALDFDYSNYHAGPNLLERLGQLIQVSEAAANRLVDSYQASKPRETAIPRELRLRLWILDICAYIERSSGKTNSGTHYQDRLSALLLATGTEDRIFFQNEVIDGFLSLNSDTVLGPLWFVPIFRTAALARDEGEAPVSVRTVIKTGEDTSRWTRFAEAL